MHTEGIAKWKDECPKQGVERPSNFGVSGMNESSHTLWLWTTHELSEGDIWRIPTKCSQASKEDGYPEQNIVMSFLNGTYGEDPTRCHTAGKKDAYPG
ncbi:hypothetical protein GJ744_001573 [Endocarpon pusillum]|uniref:Uncharacterized protein n=1 Tax=Endocarpon pusillum TaxID=364733 RepID=A0A8H7E386_9EURO|nr:hypothetical protein GJ744_001573 [Endocarpon pusillum]